MRVRQSAAASETERKRQAKKIYYKIGEACRSLDIQPYVLRYWETEFPLLSPSKSKSGQRVYTKKELDVIRRIKELLYEEGYTIAGAKKKLEAEIEAGGPQVSPDWKAGASQAGRARPDKRKGGEPETSSLDSVTAQRVERLRQGIEQARDEAQEILAFLDSKSSVS